MVLLTTRDLINKALQEFNERTKDFSDDFVVIPSGKPLKQVRDELAALDRACCSQEEVRALVWGFSPLDSICDECLCSSDRVMKMRTQQVFCESCLKAALETIAVRTVAPKIADY